MGWIERIWGSEEPRLPVHQLRASIAEAKRSRVTVAAVVADFTLTAQDQTEIQSLISGALTAQEIEDVLLRAQYLLDDGSRLAGCESPAAIRTRLGI